MLLRAVMCTLALGRVERNLHAGAHKKSICWAWSRSGRARDTCSAQWFYLVLYLLLLTPLMRMVVAAKPVFCAFFVRAFMFILLLSQLYTFTTAVVKRAENTLYRMPLSQRLGWGGDSRHGSSYAVVVVIVLWILDTKQMSKCDDLNLCILHVLRVSLSNDRSACHATLSKLCHSRWQLYLT